MKKLILAVSSLILLVVLNYSIYQKETIKADGDTVYLELAPVDPRSLMQGDYMRLRYAIERNQNYKGEQKRGYMVIGLDQRQVGTFKRFHQGEPLAANEKLLRFHNQYGQIRIVPDSFMFQEGHAQLYSQAKYGVFKFDKKGQHILVGLADSARHVIHPDRL